MTSWLPLWDHEFVASIFRMGAPIAEKILRPVLVYLALVVLLRVFGKRELAQLNPFDLVVLLSLSNTVQNAIIGQDSSVTGGLIGATALLSVNYLLVRFLFKHRRIDQIVEGSPTVLVKDGRLCEEGLARELMSASDLLTIAHRQGFACVEDIHSCVLEPGGTFYIEGKSPHLGQRRHDDLLGRLDLLSRQIEDLNKRLAAEPVGSPGRDGRPA